MDNTTWITLSDNYEYAVRAILNMIRSEMNRMYWNQNQQEMNSPFDNTGAKTFSTDVFTVRSYNWENNILPNFETEKLRVFWYKHSNRGICAQIPNGAHAEDILCDALYDSIKSLKKYFKEN